MQIQVKDQIRRYPPDLARALSQFRLSFKLHCFIIFYRLVLRRSGRDNNGGGVLCLERQVVKDSPFIVFLEFCAKKPFFWREAQTLTPKKCLFIAKKGGKTELHVWHQT